MMSKLRCLNIVLLCFAVLFTSGCQLLHFGQMKPSVETWEIGTSAGRLDQLDAATFNQLRDAGFACIEVGISRIRSEADLEEMKKNAIKVAELSRKSGVDIWSIHIPYGRDIDISLIDEEKRKKALEEVCQMFTLCTYLKPQKLVIHGSFEPVPREERAQRLAASIKSLHFLVQQAAKYDAQLTVECLPRTCLGNTAKETNIILGQVRDLEVCCDVNHMLQEKPEEYIMAVGSPITTLHIAEYDGIDERHWLPGAEGGVIDWNKLIGALEAIGYNGPFMFECAGSIPEQMACWNKLKSTYLLHTHKLP